MTKLPQNKAAELLAASEARFDGNPARHLGLVWAKVQARLEANPGKLWSLAEMERTGGEPDVVGVSRANSFSWIARRKVRLAGATGIMSADSGGATFRRGRFPLLVAVRRG